MSGEEPPFGSDDQKGDRRNRQHFHVFTNPLEMEMFFSQQMDQLLKSFGLFGPNQGENGDRVPDGSVMPGLPSIFPMPPNQFGRHPSMGTETDSEKGSRDYMLKEDSEKREKRRPGYVEPDFNSYRFNGRQWRGTGNGTDSLIKDTDLDDEGGGVTSEELSELYKNPKNRLDKTEDHLPIYPSNPSSDRFGHSNGFGLFGDGGIFGGREGGLFPFSKGLPQIMVSVPMHLNSW